MITNLSQNNTQNSYKRYKKFINSKPSNRSKLAQILSKKSPPQDFQRDFVGDHNMC